MADDLSPYVLLSVLLILIWSFLKAAGRLAPKAAFAPIVFLVTRTPVLIAWGFGTVGMMALLLPGALERGHNTTSDLMTMSGLSVFCGLGVATMVVAPVWVVVRAMAEPPVFELLPGESVLEKRLANHYLNGEARGGEILFTTQRLGFRPHRFNVQLATWSARFEDIRGFEVEGARFLVVKTAGGGEGEWLVVERPALVAERLRELSRLTERERVA